MFHTTRNHEDKQLIIHELANIVRRHLAKSERPLAASPAEEMAECRGCETELPVEDQVECQEQQEVLAVLLAAHLASTGRAGTTATPALHLSAQTSNPPTSGSRVRWHKPKQMRYSMGCLQVTSVKHESRLSPRGSEVSTSRSMGAGS